MKLTDATLNPEFANQIREANGRRRERTVSVGIASEFHDVKSFQSWNGGTVPNSYGYPALMTVVVARVHRGRLYARANKRSASGTGCGDVIHGGKWKGPTTVKGLREAGFVLIGDVA